MRSNVKKELQNICDSDYEGDHNKMMLDSLVTGYASRAERARRKAQED